MLTLRDFEKLGVPTTCTSLSPASVRLKGFSGSEIPCRGKHEFTVKVNGQTKNVVLRVVDAPGPSLLGRDLLSVLQLQWKEIFTVTLEIDNAIERAKIREEFMAMYPELFDTSTVGKLKSTQVRLRVRENHPVCMKARTIPFAIREKYERTLDDLESSGIIQKVNFSKWASPTVPVLKPDGSIRICAD
eukprot:scpid88301/ scgid15660/ Uncharacterized protein K02A2.6